MPTPDRKALDWSDEELDALAEIAPGDVEQAKIQWRKDAPPEFADLLDATPDETPEA